MTKDTRKARGPHIGPPYPTETIAPRRRALGLTQMQLAARMGIEINTLRRWEQATGNPNPDNQERLDAILGPRPAQEEER